MKARERSEVLITQFADHIELLHTDHTQILSYIFSLEDLVEEYRGFASSAKLSTMDDMTTKSKLLEKTSNLIGPVPKEETPTYRFQVDKDEAEKREQ